MSESTAIFTSTIVVDFDSAEQTPADALSNYIAEHDVSTSFELQSVEPKSS